MNTREEEKNTRIIIEHLIPLKKKILLLERQIYVILKSMEKGTA